MANPPRSPTRTEHKLSGSQYARTQLTKFAAALRTFRAEQKVSRGILAAKAGCSGQLIANIEKKACYPSFAVYAALCREMGQEPLPNFPTA